MVQDASTFFANVQRCLIHVKHGWCDACYNSYKNTEEQTGEFKTKTISAKHMSSKAVYKILKAQSDLTIMRVRYSDTCDVPIEDWQQQGKQGHTEDILIHKRQQLKNLTRDLMAAINREVFIAADAMQQFLSD